MGPIFRYTLMRFRGSILAGANAATLPRGAVLEKLAADEARCGSAGGVDPPTALGSVPGDAAAGEERHGALLAQQPAAPVPRDLAVAEHRPGAIAARKKLAGMRL